jgi:hypothetical protein
MTHETHRCSVDSCPSLAAYEVMLYDFDPEEGGVRFERDETCPYLCFEHTVDNERGAQGERAVHALVVYPHTNRDRRHGISVYLDLPSADLA